MINLQMIKTVGELKKYLEQYSDNTPIFQYESNMEKSGYFEGVIASSKLFSKVKKETWDRFDHTNYSYETYEPDDNGNIIGLNFH